MNLSDGSSANNGIRSRTKIGLFLLFGFVLLGTGFQNCGGFRTPELETNNSTSFSNGEVFQLSLIAGSIGGEGNIDGVGVKARFGKPSGMAIDASGNLFVADTRNSTIRKVEPQGTVTIFAGLSGESGSSDGARENARFGYPSGIAVDSSGNLFVADTSNHTIRKIDPQGNVTTVAGLASNFGSSDGAGANARFYYPVGIAVDSSGNLFVTDTSNHTIRKIDPQGNVTTVAGLANYYGSDDGAGAIAKFKLPQGIAVDASGNLFLTDYGNQTIRKIDSQGNVTTIAGLSGNSGTVDGISVDARFHNPNGIVVDSVGNLFLTDMFNHTIRKIDLLGNVTTIAGLAKTYGSSDGAGQNAKFSYPFGILIDFSGSLFVSDSKNSTIRKIDQQGNVTTVAGLSGIWGTTDGSGASARFNFLGGTAADSSGNLFVADSNNNTIRKIDPQGNVTTVAGLAGNTGSADGAGANARFNFPYGIAVDSSGNLYVADYENHSIRKIDPQSNVTTIFGASNRIGIQLGPKGSLDYTNGIAYLSDHSLIITTDRAVLRLELEH